MAAADITVSIVSYNTCEPLRRCLRSLQERQEAGEAVLEVIVQDNGSSDGSQGMVRSEFPAVYLRQSQDNLGYGRANNAALAEATGSLFLILNSDTVVLPGTLATMRDFFTRHADAAAVGPRLVLPDGKTQQYRLQDPDLLTVLILQLGMSSLLTARMPDRFAAPVEQLCGAALMVRCDAYEAVGGFDPKFFMYYEDVDLCRRLRRAGGSLWYLPQAMVRHDLGGSSAQNWQTRAAMIVAHNHSGLEYFQRAGGLRAAAQVRQLFRLGALLRLLIWRLLSVVRPQARDQVFLFRSVWQAMGREQP